MFRPGDIVIVTQDYRDGRASGYDNVRCVYVDYCLDRLEDRHIVRFDTNISRYVHSVEHPKDVMRDRKLDELLNSTNET